MKIKFYLLPFLLFLFIRGQAQDCNQLSVNCTTVESRCVATGSIQVTVTGGSGNYTYKAVGPVTTPSTSTPDITGLGPGAYTVIVKDLNTGCTKQVSNVVVPGSYSDPRFQLTKTDVTCANNNGTITVINQQFGRAPFSYSIIAPSPAGIGTTNSTGVFSGLPGGEYSIQLTDSCGGIQVRKVTIDTYHWWIDQVTVNPVGCDSAFVSVTIRDNRGNVNNSNPGSFIGFQYGYVVSGDTSWMNSSQFMAFIGNIRNITVLVKDPCGQIIPYQWSFPLALQPSLSNATISALGCSTFTASVTGQNMNVFLYCLENSSGTTIACNNSGVFTGLAYGSYCIKGFEFCYDTVITRCFTVSRPKPAIGSNVNITNRNCSTFSASITGKQNLTNPQYCLYNNTGVQLSCNTTGVFNSLPYGTYCITMQDGCTDTIIQRCFTVTRLLPVLNAPVISNSNCSTFTVTSGGNNLINPVYCLYDESGNLISCNSTGTFNGIDHGGYCIRAISCGDTVTRCFSTGRPVPTVGNVSINRQCSTFRATLTGSNLTNPSFCLMDSENNLVTCNNTGVFEDLPYGSYCIRVINTCYDTVITRCFSASQPIPSLNSTIQVLSRTCNTVTIKANGSNLTNPRYCLFDQNNELLECNLTGVFNNLPYGYYCIEARNNCYDTTIRVCGNFLPVKGMSLSTSKPCALNSTYIDVNFASGRAPFNIKIYHPNGSLVKDTNTGINPQRLLLPALPGATQYMVIGRDSCGNRDTAWIIPNANIVSTNTTVKAKCPSAAWLNGSGDILASCSSNHYSVLPKIIKKNNAAFVQNYSSVNGNVYTFADLEPAQYVLEYTQQTCNLKIYDTLIVNPYTYPTQGQSAIYQCDNNGFSMGADVSGGVSPYSYQIIGSLPTTPSITTTPQISAVFNINNGTVYSLVRLRTIDACGNATLSDVSVLPLQNISITASDSCFYQNILLKVDTIPNATYYWYKKTSPTDSILLDSGLTYNLPFFQPEDIGQYVCKMVVNLGCVTRLANFNLFGCYNTVLANSVELKGKRTGGDNHLNWNHPSAHGVTKYVLERKTRSEDKFMAIAERTPSLEGQYHYTDLHIEEEAHYRVKVVTPQKFYYSNVVMLGQTSHLISTFPNPVANQWQIRIEGKIKTRYSVDLINSAGQLMYTDQFIVNGSALLNFKRHQEWNSGMYMLRITDMNAGTTEIRKLLFE